MHREHGTSKILLPDLFFNAFPMFVLVQNNLLLPIFLLIA